ncbi:MAG: hypothetical protein HY516_02965 [Candidatus Aenigmarchaeota archaeon]|nr:hypothetical protein [Candidatus Aenigmarchaeota archaeon]
MALAFLFALSASFLVTGRLFGNKVDYERVFYSTILSFIILFSSGVLLNLFGQIGTAQITVVNLVLLGAAVHAHKKPVFDKIEFNMPDYAALLVFLMAFFVRAAPIISDPAPFGSYDVIQHYAMAMETYEGGAVPNEFPKYLNWYGASQDNVNGVWVYPPGNAIMLAVMKSVFNLSWPYTVHIFSALFDAFTVLIIYMICGKVLKDVRAGVVAATLFSVSGKNIFSLYFGQVAYELGIMLSMFALFVYVSESHLKNWRVAVSGLVGGLSFLVSPLAAGYFIFAAFFVSAFEWRASKNTSHLKNFATAVVVLLAVSSFFLPKFAAWSSFFGARPAGTPDSLSLPDLVWPFRMIAKQPGLPGWYFDPGVTLGIPWLVLIVVGLGVLALSRFEGRRKVAAWLAADYVLTHSYILWGPLGFGVLYDYAGRWMAQSSVILAVVAGLVAAYRISNKDGKLFISRNEGVPIGLVVFILILLAYVPEKVSAAGSIYAQPYRMSAGVYSLMDDVRADTADNSAMLVFSANVQAADERRGLTEALSKTRVYTQPSVNNGELNLTFVHNYAGGSITYDTRYIMFDYSGFAKSAQFADYVQYYSNAEKSLFGNVPPAFTSGDVRIYRLVDSNG